MKKITMINTIEEYENNKENKIIISGSLINKIKEQENNNVIGIYINNI